MKRIVIFLTIVGLFVTGLQSYFVGFDHSPIVAQNAVPSDSAAPPIPPSNETQEIGSSSCGAGGNVWSTDAGTPISVRFVNNSGINLNIDWIDYSRNNVGYGQIENGTSLEFTTYPTHPWLFTNSLTGECVGLIPSASDGQVYTIMPPTNVSDYGYTGPVHGSNETGVEYIVQWGDHLSQIAKAQMGNAKAWPQIVAATNQRALTDPRFSLIHNPKVIIAGQRLFIPFAVEVPAEAADTVEPADGLIAPDMPMGTSDNYVSPDGLITEAPDIFIPTMVSPDFTPLFPQTPDGDLYGYVDVSGQYVIEPKYVIAGPFHEERAAVSIDGSWFGFIDPTGAMVIPDTFGGAGIFSDGLAPVSERDGGLSGYISRSGGWVISPQYYRAEPFVNGFAKVINARINGSPVEEVEVRYIDMSGNPLYAGSMPVNFPTRETIWRRIGLPSTVTDRASDMVCTNHSRHLTRQHPAIWSCAFGDTKFDPCVVGRDNVSLVCDGHSNPFVAQTLEQAIVDDSNIGDVAVIDQLYLLDVGAEKTNCTALADPFPVGKSWITYHCDDGSFLLDSPMFVPQRNRRFVEQVRFADDVRGPTDFGLINLDIENASIKRVSIGEIVSLCTSNADQSCEFRGGQGDLIPVTGGVSFNAFP